MEMQNKKKYRNWISWIEKIIQSQKTLWSANIPGVFASLDHMGGERPG